MAKVVEDAREAMRTSQSAGFNDMTLGAMQNHVIYSYLTADERTKLREAANGGRYDEAIALFGDAAVRAADPEVEKKAQE